MDAINRDAQRRGGWAKDLTGLGMDGKPAGLPYNAETKLRRDRSWKTLKAWTAGRHWRQ
jgi:hypothetical protein